MTHLRLLQGPEIKNVLLRNDVVIFRYQLNIPIANLGGAIVLIGLALAALCWWETRLATLLWQAVFAGVVLGSVSLAAWVGYWVSFAKTKIVVAAPEGLYVGGNTGMWAIAWGLLSREALGLDDLQVQRLSGSLLIQVAGQEVPLHLYNIFAYLSDIEGLMFHLLQAIEGIEAEGGDAVDATEAE